MFVLNHHPSVANHFLAELRNTAIQNDRLRFRTNLERLGQLLAYELSKTLHYQKEEIQTPLSKTVIPLLPQHPVIISVLRAAVPFYQGVLSYFDHSDSGFIGAYRKHHAYGEDVNISLDYVAAPDINGRTVILVDTMLATGKSFVKTVDSLLGHGRPEHIHVVAAIAAPEGIAYIKEHIDFPHNFWLGALDEKLDPNSYIIPGLGDAGDLAFGPKL